MSDVFPNGFTTLNGGQYGVVELTPGELRALFSAVDSYLNAAGEDECRTVFGSAAGTRAASRAKDKLIRCGRAMHAFDRPRATLPDTRSQVER
jgi:hypothetical protein